MDINNQTNEMSLKEILDIVKEYIDYLKSKWLYIFVFAAIGFGIGAYMALKTPPTFQATNTFLVEEDEGSSMGGLSSALSSFGLGGGGTTGKYNYDKVVSISKSKRVMMNALLDTMHQSSTLIGNYIIEAYDMKDAFLDDDGKGTFTIRRHVSFDSLTIAEKKIMNTLYNKVCMSDDRLFSISYNENSKIITSTVTSIDERLSYSLIQSIYRHLNNFYTHQATVKYSENVGALKSRLDSVKTNLFKKESELAYIIDKNLGISYSSNRLQEGRLMRDVEIGTNAYLEIYKSYETSLYMLSSMRPVFTLVDEVYLPLRKEGINYIKNGLVLSLILGFLSIGFFVVRYFFLSIT